MPNKYISDSRFVEGADKPRGAVSPKMGKKGKEPPANAANTAKPGGKMNVLKMWSKDNHKTGIRK